jgi:ubiquinone/menaquinone biosynthesis C-methylase UbiE
MAGVDYESAWDAYARAWSREHPGLAHLGDEWTGAGAGAAASLADYLDLIDRRFVEPYVRPDDTVLELGVGGGRTSEILLRRCARLVGADVSAEMLALARERLGEERATWVKLDGRTLDGLPDGAADVCFSYDTLVHLEPRDIFNYLTRLPRVLRGRRVCILHHANTISDLGFRKFLSEWEGNLGGRRHGAAFSVMTDSIMQRFLDHLGYEVLERDSSSVPRDFVWVCRAPGGGA